VIFLQIDGDEQLLLLSGKQNLLVVFQTLHTLLEQILQFTLTLFNDFVNSCAHLFKVFNMSLRFLEELKLFLLHLFVILRSAEFLKGLLFFNEYCLGRRVEVDTWKLDK